MSENVSPYLEKPSRSELEVKHERLETLAKELWKALLASQEELRLIHMKDTASVYNPALRVQTELALSRARAAGLIE